MTSPILQDKHYDAPSAFTAENLLREARRQKRGANAAVPRICVLDPDGDALRYRKRMAALRTIPHGPAITRNSIASSRRKSNSVSSVVL
jgi:hypothetical protein